MRGSTLSDKAISRDGSARHKGEVLDSPAARPASYRPTYVIQGTLSKSQSFWEAIRKRLSFWTVLAGIMLGSSAYLFLFADSMYVSESMFSLQNKSSIGTSLTTIIGSGISSGSSGNEDAALVAYITSHEMLNILDKKFHLREIWSDYRHNPFWRLDKNASDEDFLLYYQSMVEVDLQHDVGIITIRYLDYESPRSKQVAEAILTESEKFMNRMSDAIREETLRYAKTELAQAEAQVSTAQTQDREIAERRLQAAQGAMATALSLANSQQVFVVRISNPTLPSETTRPQRVLDLAAVGLGTAVFYAIFFLIFANIREHRKI